MTTARKTGRWIAAGLGICIVAGVAVVASTSLFRGSRTKIAANPVLGSTIVELSAAARLGNNAAAEGLLAKLDPKNQTEPSISDTESEQLAEVIGSLRAGFLQFQPKSRLVAMGVTAAILDRFSSANAPGNWVDILGPVHDLLNSGLGDGEPAVRAAALSVISRSWGWAPNRSLIAIEEVVLAEWKQGFHTGVVRRLADKSEVSRAAAVACLGALPVDRAAAPATAYLDDSSPTVRRQVLNSFAGRTGILTEDAILVRTNDSEPDIAQMAEVILRGRGLSAEQIGLGRMIVNAKAEVRLSVLGLLKDRNDIDPMTWLLQLSHDKEESIRAKVMPELAAQLDSPEARKRLREMAASDSSATIRAAAAKLAPAPGDTTASLPPLPGSPSLNPKAN